jgi:hypothetical protein
MSFDSFLWGYLITLISILLILIAALYFYDRYRRENFFELYRYDSPLISTFTNAVPRSNVAISKPHSKALTSDQEAFVQSCETGGAEVRKIFANTS